MLSLSFKEQALKTDSDKETVKEEKEEKKERKKSGQEEKMENGENGEKEEIEGTTRRRLPCFLFNVKPSSSPLPSFLTLCPANHPVIPTPPTTLHGKPLPSLPSLPSSRPSPSHSPSTCMC